MSVKDIEYMNNTEVFGVDIENKQNKSLNKTILDKAKKEKRLGIHSFHRYYGKLIPAIPRAFIRQYTNEKDLIFDPFAGSGTTGVESFYLNRNFLGVEINPLSVMIIKAKLEDYDVDVLHRIAERLHELVINDNDPISENEIPFVINREHWFKSAVQTDLVIINRNFSKVILELKIPNKEIYYNFLKTVLSATIKQVSNADTMHVFPGISKRIRRLEAEGKNEKNTKKTFFANLKKRIKYVQEFGNHSETKNIIVGDSSSVDLKKYKEKVKLVVTNPPYISSVRYAETLKLELYWMQYVLSSEDYIKLSTSMIGNDRIIKGQAEKCYLTGLPSVDETIKRLYEIDKKQAKVVYDYFTLMEKVIEQIKLVLVKDGRVVIKISDSKIRKVSVKTGYLLSDIAKGKGFIVEEIFNDKINQNSRSLLTARNTYSDIILEDNIVIWRKK